MERLVLGFLLLSILNGCSVIMAATSREAPDMNNLQRGTDRARVEEILGRPISFRRDSAGDKAVYQFISNDKASYERAAVYAVLDGITLGIAEFFTFGVEAVQGDRHEIEVTYTPRGEVISIIETIHSAPLEKPEKILGIEEDPALTIDLGPAKPELPVES